MIKINEFLALAQNYLPGNKENFQLGLISILLNRSLLIEDVPGMGKTTFVKFFAQCLGLKFGRIQFTSDLLPADILGVSIYQREAAEFIFKAGPIFSELVLADELNRGAPKVQSALLEALEEKQVSIDGHTYPLPERFCLIATQNPRGQLGTYPLPESQLDRFLFKTTMGKLSRTDEINILKEGSRREILAQTPQLITHQDLSIWSSKLSSVHTSQNILEYVLDLVEKTRSNPALSGLSPRASRDLLDAAKALAFMNERDFVIPDDVAYVFPYVAGHRICNTQTYSFEQEYIKAREIIDAVKVNPQ